MLITSKPTAIDLFCGCGGISVGMERSGFRVLAGIDVEKKYIASFHHNFPHAHAVTTDIAAVHVEDFMRNVEINAGDLDLLVGGPPCQGFSKNVPRRNRYMEDPKNLLVKSFLDYCEVLQPKMVLMENVAEMKNGFDEAYSKEIISRLHDEGYTVTSVILNAADYGVPQRRRRAFFMANRFGVTFSMPSQTHIKCGLSQDNTVHNFDGRKNHVTVWDAIGDLPSVECGKGEDISYYATQPQNEFQRQMRGNRIYTRNHTARKLTAIQYERLASIEPGQGHKDLPKHLQTKSKYSGAYGRLTKNMVAPTITRWVFHPGSGRWGHPNDIRTLTIREAARIQSFPDDYEFVGSYIDQAGQLGNAVPPLLAQAIVTHMRNQLAMFMGSRKSFHETF